jgi:hypothetical protein
MRAHGDQKLLAGRTVVECRQLLGKLTLILPKSSLILRDVGQYGIALEIALQTHHYVQRRIPPTFSRC